MVIYVIIYIIIYMLIRFFTCVHVNIKGLLSLIILILIKLSMAYIQPLSSFPIPRRLFVNNRRFFKPKVSFTFFSGRIVTFCSIRHEFSSRREVHVYLISKHAFDEFDKCLR